MRKHFIKVYCCCRSRSVTHDSEWLPHASRNTPSLRCHASSRRVGSWFDRRGSAAVDGVCIWVAASAGSGPLRSGRVTAALEIIPQ